MTHSCRMWAYQVLLQFSDKLKDKFFLQVTYFFYLNFHLSFNRINDIYFNFSGSMTVLANFPNPVVIPYTTVFNKGENNCIDVFIDVRRQMGKKICSDFRSPLFSCKIFSTKLLAFVTFSSASFEIFRKGNKLLSN